MTTNNITARTYNSIAKDHEEKKLLVSASFLKKAGKYGTKEAKALEKEMKKYPSYKIEVKVAEKEKKSPSLKINSLSHLILYLSESLSFLRNTY